MRDVTVLPDHEMIITLQKSYNYAKTEHIAVLFGHGISLQQLCRQGYLNTGLTAQLETFQLPTLSPADQDSLLLV